MCYQKLLFIVVLLFSNSSHAKIFKWVDEHGRTQFSDQPHPSATEIELKGTIARTKKSALPVAETNVALSKVEYLKTFNSDNITLKLRALLKQHKFDELNKILEQYYRSYLSDVSQEQLLFTAYQSFRIKNKLYLSLFDAWVDTTPEAYPAYLARAIYRYQLGWTARGNKYISKTSAEQITAMAVLFDKSMQDIILALNINEQQIVSLSYMMGLSITLGRDDEVKRWTRKALKVNPASFYIRKRYLQTITPRWGGSMELLQAYVNETLKYSDINPRLKLLEGFVAMEAGDMLVLDKKYDAADEMYKNSLKSGRYHVTLFKRGKNNVRRGKYKAAINNLNQSIALYSEDPLYYYWRAAAYDHLLQYKDAMKDIQFAYQLDPDDKDIQNKRKWILSKINQDNELKPSAIITSTIKKYTNEIRLNPDYAKSYNRRARAYVQERNYQQALVDIKKAIELDPDFIDHYLVIDHILFKNDKLNQIIDYWDMFIARNPDNARAYLERAGTHSKKRDLTSTLRDLKKSAELGSVEGKESYEKLKEFAETHTQPAR